MTLQFLVENAVKHNKTVKTHPLQINISSVGNGELLITNTLIPLVNEPVSIGIGLENIISRYALLSDKTVEISKTADLFKVKIPLLS